MKSGIYTLRVRAFATFLLAFSTRGGSSCSLTLNPDELTADDLLLLGLTLNCHSYMFNLCLTSYDNITTMDINTSIQ